MKILTVIGARPQFIKAAAVSAAIEEFNQKVRKDFNEINEINEIIVNTGQHYDKMMASIFFEELNLPSPHYNLNIGSSSHGKQTGEMLIKLEPLMLSEKPDWVLVYGDTNSTLAGALTAAKLHIPIAHVESGLRSFNKNMPEEINRVITDNLANILFCPSEVSETNLKNEGIVENVHIVGDVMFDSIISYSKLLDQHSTVLKRLNVSPKSFALATVHRAENTDDIIRLGSIFMALDKIATSDLPVIMPLHPRTNKMLQEFQLTPKKIKVIEPVSYLDMLALIKQARIILTDSGGMQKEAYWLSVPCVTLRDETEWIELIEEGCNITSGTRSADIYQAFLKLIDNTSFNNSSIYGLGNASQKIIEILINNKVN